MIGSVIFLYSDPISEDFFINYAGSYRSEDWTQTVDGAVSGVMAGLTKQPYYYYIQLTNADGVYGADISSESDPIPNDTGEISGDTIRRGKGIALSGKIWGRDLTQLAYGAQYLQQMFWSTTLRQLYWIPLTRTGQATLDYNQSVYLYVRVNNDLVVSQSLDDIQASDQMPTWSWTVGLRADDPRIYNSSDDTPYQSWQT